MKLVTGSLLAFLIFLAMPSFAQEEIFNASFPVIDTLQDELNLFESDDLLEVSLRFDITYYKRKKSDIEYLDAMLTYYTGENDSVSKELKVRARGEIRRKICEFPPLMLNFKMKDSIESEFSRINKLKMVTHCKAGNDEAVLREYLVYKLYNVLTDYSFKVRLMKINYINTSKNKKPISEYAFAIEPVEFLAARFDAFETLSTTLDQKSIQSDMLDRMAIFNYMIGNSDWTIPNQHNVVIIAKPDQYRYDFAMIIPFDFDYAGIVNADYAVPADFLGIESVRDRIYLGMCRPDSIYLNALKEFTEKKDEFYKIITEDQYLDKRSKNYMTNYLDGFYNLFDRQNSIVYELLKDCK